MKTTMKKTAAYLLAILLVFQMIPAFAETSKPFTLQDVEYREKLNISAVVDTLVVGHTLTLTVDEEDKYTKIKWTSNKEDIATVENGVVTGVAAGTVTITATEDGHNDSVTLRVIEAKKESNAGKETDESGTGESETGEVETGEGETEEITSEKMIVIINGAKQKTTYNGEEIWLGFVANSSAAGFEEGKVHLKEDSHDHLAHGLTCGVWQDELSDEDFYYEGNDNVEFVVSNGWLQIKPAVLNIYVNDAEKNEGEDDPVFTAEYDKLLGQDTAETLGLTFRVSENGQITPAIADDGIIADRYRKGTVMAGTLTIKQMNEYPLYNLAVIKVGSTETWYRLGKTTIKTKKTLDEYIAGLKADGNTNVVTADEYVASPYDFDDLEITVNGKKYVYKCDKNAEAILMGADYYTAKLKNVEAARKKIGGSGGWLIPEDQRYGDDNKTNSIHMNYTITLYEADVKAEDQDIYYMLSVDGSQDYYKLPRGTITAKPYDRVTIIDQKLKQVKESDYILTPYDFTNTVITIDGVDYKYNDGSLDEYENYFTVEFDMVVKSERFNSNANWFKNTESWLDGAYEQYGTLPNYTKAFHANYNATTHKALPRTRSVSIESNWPEGKIAYPGAKITLTAKLEGFGENVTLQWQHSTDQENWTDEPGANEISYTYTLDETTAYYYWRVFADDAN